MHISAAAMQTLGTALQLLGATVTFGGLLWAWHTASGLLRKWAGALHGRFTRIADAIARLVVAPPPHEIVPGGATISLHGGQPIVTSELPGHGELAAMVRALDATENRLNQLEHGHQALRDQLTQLDSNVRPEIDAITKELEDAKEVHLKGLYPALGGILVSIIGYVCALIGYLSA